MAKIIIINIIRFVLLIFLQVALLKNIGYYNIATAFPYILFILLLPISISNFTLYLLAFITGLTVDAFYDSMGVHTSACIVLAYFRIFFMNITLDVDNKESLMTPSWGNMKFKWFITYIVLGTLIQHLALFLIEVFSFQNISNTILSIILSTAFSVVIILTISLLTYSNKNKLASY